MLDIIRPGDPRYGRVRHVYTGTGSPAAVIRPRTAAEVAEALAWAREHEGPLAIRSGGHGISSRATNDGGTVVDLAELGSVERIDGDLVRVGAGARWADTARTLRPWGLAVTSGDSGGVGVGGLGTTGGIGFLGRVHGLTIDHVVAAEIVTADGRIRTVDAENEPDLFWAVRGAGANVGIVTSLDLRASRTPAVARAMLQYRPGDVAAFLEAWGATVEAAPREVTAFAYLSGSGHAMGVVVYAGDDARAAERALAPFTRLAPLTGRNAELMPYAEAILDTREPHGGQQTAYMRNGFAVHLDQSVSERAASLLHALPATMLQIRATGGAVNDVPAEATAFAHRHQHFNIAIMTNAPTAMADRAWEDMRPALDGLYLSFETVFSPQRLADAFPPATLERLREIKRKVDPDNVFHQNFPVA
ncbi:FAD-binding oxidoreductase [Glycomyces sp. NPDC048151]|uniref:FAD-binding oxidoreductase n=1 Tax=Glycomyces sp. NPDC048151 TaxID=3364002 RepID=UPI003717E875